MAIINAFLSGILYFVYMLTDGWFWLFGLGIIIAMSFIENREVESEFIDDERRLL